jgi:hypothetical protein
MGGWFEAPCTIETAHRNGLRVASKGFSIATMHRRRKHALFWTVVSFLLLSGCLLYFSSPAPKYRGYVRVAVKPFTNALMTTLLQSPGTEEFRLRKGGPGLIEIMVESQTIEGAKKKGEEVTALFRLIAQKEHGAELLVVDSFEEPLHPLSRPIEALNRVLEPPLKKFGIVH